MLENKQTDAAVTVIHKKSLESERTAEVIPILSVNSHMDTKHDIRADKWRRGRRLFAQPAKKLIITRNTAGIRRGVTDPSCGIAVMFKIVISSC
jgi:hypothetical protein